MTMQWALEIISKLNERLGTHLCYPGSQLLRSRTISRQQWLHYFRLAIICHIVVDIYVRSTLLVYHLCCCDIKRLQAKKDEL